MGSLKLPDSGIVYVDANIVIYSVEKVPPFGSVLQPLWNSAAARGLAVVSSELTVLETLVKPIRAKKDVLEPAFRAFLFRSDEFRLVPIELYVIERAARIRADCGLQTPDALHAATALEENASMFITNDAGFRRVPGLPVTVLSEVLDS